jgi:polyphosphate kinase 2
MQEWVKANDERLLILFEGRDAAGKGSAIKRFVENLNVKHFRIESFGIPSKYEEDHWFERYERVLPQKGEIVFFDRSWYTRAVTEPTMGYCSDNQYEKFMSDVLPFEHKLVKDGVRLIKFWFSITKQKQKYRFALRQASPLKYWKYSPNDEAAVKRWETFTKYKEAMFDRTSSTVSPWIVVDGNDKKVARLNAMRYVLNQIPYANRDEGSLDYFTEVVYPIGVKKYKV